MILYLENDELPDEDEAARRILLSAETYFLFEDNVLYHIERGRSKSTTTTISQLVIPQSLKYEILVNTHDDVTAGHLGVTKTYAKIKARYYWKGMYQDVDHWCKSCADCATRKTPKNRLKAPLLPIPVEGAFDRVAVDCLGPLPPSILGNRYIVVFSDYLTKWPEAFAVSTIEASTIARLLVDEIVARHGAPRTLLSDRGSNFLSNLISEVCKLLSIRKLNTTAYHPQCDGLVERFNATLAQSLSMYVSKNQRDWDSFVPSVLFAYRTSISETTRETPFYLLYGREPRLPLDVSLLAPQERSSAVGEHRARIVEAIERSQRLARENNQRAQQKMKFYYDKRSRDVSFAIGERVWVYTPKTKEGLSKKLLHNWHGPFRIVERLSPVHFKLRTCTNRPVQATVHANRMKPYFDPDDRPIAPPEKVGEATDTLQENELPEDSFDNPSDPQEFETDEQETEETQEDMVEIDNEEIFNAEKILKSRVRKGKEEFLVKWANFPNSQATCLCRTTKKPAKTTIALLLSSLFSISSFA